MHKLPTLLLSFVTAAALLGGLTGCTAPKTQTESYTSAGKQIAKQLEALTNDIPTADRLQVLRYSAQKSQCDTARFEQSEQRAIYVKRSFDLTAFLRGEQARLEKQGFKVDATLGSGSTIKGTKTLSVIRGGYQYQIATLTDIQKKGVATSKGVVLAVNGPCVPE